MYKNTTWLRWFSNITSSITLPANTVSQLLASTETLTKITNAEL